MNKAKKLIFTLAICTMPFTPALAASGVPLNMKELRMTTPEITKKESLKVDGIVEDEVSLDIRSDAQKEAAMSYGARGGLAFRNYEIKERLDGYGKSLNKVYDFRKLLIKSHSGLNIEPPIISEAQNSLVISKNGIEAAVADRIYNIGKDAKIITNPRDWREYLMPILNDVITPPPKILWPVNAEEKVAWDQAFEKGWKAGVEQANRTFETQLEKLNSDFNGMIRYRMLLAQNMISAPYALHEDRGVTGGGDMMRVGDRALRITGPSQLKTGYKKWQPADR